VALLPFVGDNDVDVAVVLDLLLPESVHPKGGREGGREGGWERGWKGMRKEYQRREVWQRQRRKATVKIIGRLM